MTSSNKKSGLTFLWLSFILLLIDQGTKYWTLHSLELHESYEILSFFHFTYARNYGAAFSFLSDAGGWQKYFFTSIALCVSAFLIYSLKKSSNKDLLTNISYAMILSGAIGNVIDRVIFGYVIDFIDVDLGFYNWPIFNIADSAIFIGAAIMIFESIFHKDPSKVESEQ